MFDKIVRLSIFAGIMAVFFVPAGNAEIGNPNGNTKIIVELFTSHGCSSCPPADKVLSELIITENLNDTVIPLSFHVDYWDNLGWKDPFSYPECTGRQRRYSSIFFTNGYMYTPQMVIQGQSQCLGSDRSKVLSHIRYARRAPAKANIRIASMEIHENLLSAHIQPFVRKQIPVKELWVLAAIYENNLVTQVGKGENEGRTLHNSGVVRALHHVMTVSLLPGIKDEKMVSLPLKPEWDRENLGIAVWIQDPKTMKILCADSMDAVIEP